MNLNIRISSKIFIAMCAALTVQVAGAGEWVVGQCMSPAKLEQSGWPTVRVGSETLRVLPQTEAKVLSNSKTLVVNSLGAVGESRHSVLVSRTDVKDVQLAIDSANMSPVTVKFYDHTGISELRFSSFSEAVKAYEVLSIALSDAQVSLPIRYAERVAR